MSKRKEKLRVRELAEDLAISSDTVRYYTRIGLLKPTKNTDNGYREFDDADRSRLYFVLGARRLGFSIADIKQILHVADQGETPCPLVRHLIELHLRETEAEYQQITTLRARMHQAVSKWQKLPNKEPTGEMICHLIEGILEENTELEKSAPNE